MLEVWIAIWIMCAGIAGVITEQKGQGWGLGLAAGGALGILGIAIAVFAEDKTKDRNDDGQ